MSNFIQLLLFDVDEFLQKVYHPSLFDRPFSMGGIVQTWKGYRHLLPTNGGC